MQETLVIAKPIRLGPGPKRVARGGLSFVGCCLSDAPLNRCEADDGWGEAVNGAICFVIGRLVELASPTVCNVIVVRGNARNSTCDNTDVRDGQHKCDRGNAEGRSPRVVHESSALAPQTAPDELRCDELIAERADRFVFTRPSG